MIDTISRPATYTLQVQGTGSGSFTLMAMMMPSAAPLQPIPIGNNPDASWPETSTATASSTWPSRTENSDTVSILMGNGDGTFQTAVNYPVGSQPAAIAVGDFTGDGKLDLAVVELGHTAVHGVSILLGNGDGTFQPDGEYPTRSDPVAIAVGDFTDDGKLDLAVAYTGSWSGKPG